MYVNRAAGRLYSILRQKWHRLIFVPPCYFVRNDLGKESVVVDWGTGYDADFSQHLIRTFGVKVYGFEPTRKHHGSLELLKQVTQGQFTYFKYGISEDHSPKTFYESDQNVSGSFFKNHTNVQHDDINAYPVDTINLAGIFQKIGIARINLLKLDIEGAEYSLLENVTEETLSMIDQIVVEFHHHCIKHFLFDDTLRVICRLQRFGFFHYTRDKRNYLFWRY